MLATIIILIVLGVVAIGLEFFLPGGILGVVGIASLAGAIVSNEFALAHAKFGR